MAKNYFDKIKEIRELKTDLEDYYKTLNQDRMEWQQYYDDEFPVGIAAPYQRIKTGKASQIVDTMVEHITIYNPIVTRNPKKKGEKSEESARKVSIFLDSLARNSIWEIEEAIKNATLLGEAIFQVQYNPDDKERPILITSPDPRIIFSDPHETNGTPGRVIKWHKMTVGMAKQFFPQWETSRKNTEEVEYLAYFDQDSRYIEIDRVPVLKGTFQHNYAGITPFCHCPSGFGKNSPDGRPETKYISILKKKLGKLCEETEIESFIDSIFKLYAHPNLVLKPLKEGKVLSQQEKDAIDLSGGMVTVLGADWDYEIRQGTAPSPEMFAHKARIESELAADVPPVAHGLPSTSGASGRQEEIYASQFQIKPSKIQKNIEWLLSVALGIALKTLENVPQALPIDIETTSFVEGKYIHKVETITKEDIDGYYHCKVEFKPDKTTERSANVMIHRTLANEGWISWKRLLIEGYGMTEEEAENEMAEAIAEKVIRQNIVAANIAAEEAFEKMGMERYSREIEARGGSLVGGELFPSRQGQPRSFTGNPASRESVKQMIGESGLNRTPPPSTGGM